MANASRWLLDNDHDEEGMVVIANLYGEGDIHSREARDEYREIKMDVLSQRQEGEKTYTDMFKRYRTRVFIAMSAQAFAQLNGINVISYYAPYVFQDAGWAGRDAILMTGINGITYLLSTIPPWYIVDRWGRRYILLSGAIVMTLTLSSISYFMYLDISATRTLVVIFVMIYNAAFGYSWGPIPWLYPPEILPLSIRSKGTSLSTATNWAFNWLVGEMTPILQDWIEWRLYLIHAFFCAVSFVLGKQYPNGFQTPLTIAVYFIYPETAGVRLEDMDVLFGDATALPSPENGPETDRLVAHNSGTSSNANGSTFPDSDVEPPHLNYVNGRPQYTAKSSGGQGLGGWMSQLVGRGKHIGTTQTSGNYKSVRQDEL